MAPKPHIAILGGGLAGHSAVETLRKEGFDGRISLISNEPIQPYDRTLLSKSVLQGARSLEEIAFCPLQHYEDLDVDMLLGAEVTSLSFSNRQITLAGADTVRFDKLLIATGASPIRLSAPGFDLPGVHYLRTARDAAGILEALQTAERVVVIGGGFIGAEVAASARMLGKEVTLVDLLRSPLSAALGEHIGQVYTQIHRNHGVDLRMHSRVTQLRGSRRVEEAILADGDQITCDLVVTGVGVRPETTLFDDTGLTLSNGVYVNESCESNIPGVYAAGDVANWWHPKFERYVRIEHFNNAADQGAAAARAMLGQSGSYAPVPYFWSDQYDVNLQFVGYPGSWDELIVRTYPDEDAMTAFYLQQHSIRAAVTINRAKDLRSARRLIEGDALINRETLVDPAADLRELAKSIQAPT